MKKIAIIGAGIAGVISASILNNNGFDVTLIDKSRGVSGRSTTKRWPTVDTGIDMGVPYLKLSELTTTVEPYLKNLLDLGIISVWKNIKEINSQIEKIDTYIGMPKMSSIARFLSANIRIIPMQKIDTVKKVINKWVVRSSSDEFSDFDVVIFAIPSLQLNDIKGIPTDLNTQLAHNLKYDAINTLLIETKQPLWNDEKNELELNDSIIHSIIANYKKSGREDDHFTYTVQSNEDWATDTFDKLSKEDVEKALVKELKKKLKLKNSDILHSLLHRWRYAIPSTKNSGFNDGYFQSKEDDTFLVCGDWCNSPNYLGAMESGILAANAVK